MTSSNVKPFFVIQDFLLLEEICNIACSYCEGYYHDGIPFKRNNDRLIMPASWMGKLKLIPAIKEFIKDSLSIDDLFRIADETLKRVAAIADIPILKISGGEIYVINEIHDFIKRLAPRYEQLQILTNGTLLTPKKVSELRSIGNINLQISLDGHTPEMNHARVQNPKMTQHILMIIDEAARAGINLEVNCVLTSYNTAGLEKFLERLERHDNLLLLPRPVRGAPMRLLKPNEDQIRSFGNFVRKYEGHKNLPPVEYLLRVHRTLEQGNRSWPCYTPHTVLGSTYLGRVDTCTCGGHLPVVGNLFKDSRKTIETKNSIEHFPPQDAIAKCGNCVTNYEIIDLYIDGEITLDRILKIPLYNGVRTSSNLQKIKQKLKGSI